MIPALSKLRNLISKILFFLSPFKASLSGVGTSIQNMVQAPAIMPRAEVFRRQNRALLLLAWILHANARVSRHRRISVFYLWHRIDELRRQQAQQGDVRRIRRRQHHAMSAL